MSKKRKKPIIEDDDDEKDVIPTGVGIDISGVNFSISLKSSKKDTMKELTDLAVSVYEYLLGLQNGNDPGVQ